MCNVNNYIKHLIHKTNVHVHNSTCTCKRNVNNYIKHLIHTCTCLKRTIPME